MSADQVGISPLRNRLTWMLLYRKEVPVLTICKVAGTEDTAIGTLKDWLSTSPEVWKVCCVAAPGTATPFSFATVNTFIGKVTQLPGAKPPLNDSVYTPA